MAPYILSKKYHPTEYNYILLNHAGGLANIDIQWANKLGLSDNVLAYEYPGSGIRSTEEMPTKYKDMVSLIAIDICDKISCNTILIAKSLGSYISYDIALMLFVKLHLQVKHIIMLSVDSPFNFCSKKVNKFLESDYIRNDYYDVILRKDLTIIADYHCSPTIKLNIPITIINGIDDPFIIDPKRAQDWENVSHKVSTYLLEGDHFFYNCHQNWTKIFSIIKQNVG